LIWAGVLAALVGALAGVAIMNWSLAAAIRAERQWWLGMADALEDADSYRRASGAGDVPAELAHAAAALRAGIGTSPLLRGWQCFGWTQAAACVSLALVCSVLAWRSPTAAAAALWVGFACCLAAAAVVDARFMILPDVLTLPLMWVALAASAAGWLGVLTPAASIAGAIAGYASLWALATLYGTASGQQAMGEGDFKLMAAVGAWFGAPALVPVALAAFATASVVGLAARRTDSRQAAIPFGPHIAGAAILVALVGPHAAASAILR
jgi:leader peptidase (prepilin peptidase)/N-methyltransferase